MSKAEKVTAYKGFMPNMMCRDFQYVMGETYTHNGDPWLCNKGFHACEYPLDCFGYYAPGQSVYAVVKQHGKVVKGDDKNSSSKITIKASITIPTLVTAAIEYVSSRCDPVKAKHSTGDQYASSATGDQSASSATGYRSASSATGNRSASSATGNRSASSATGNQSASSATGNQSASSATGYRSASSATGYRSASSATGDQSASSATGNQSASSATGYQSASSATGKFAVAAAFGLESKAQAGEDGTIIIAWWDEKKERVRYTTGYVGENGIEKDTWYRCNETGELVAA